MATYTIEGIRLDFGAGGDPVSIRSAQAVITVPDSSTSFTYSLTGFGDGGVPYVDIETDAYSITIDGLSEQALLDNFDLEAFVAEVTWSGGVTNIFGVNFDTPGGNDADIYFVMGGPVPAASSLQDWANFDAAITGLNSPSGAFGPGQDIEWGDFVNATVSNADAISGTDDADDILGGAGDDTLSGGNGDDTIDGGAGKDKINAGSGSDEINGGGGKDKIKAGGGGDVVYGGSGNDNLKGQGGGDDLYGEEGNDKLNGGGKKDILDGGDGDDILKGGGGADVFVFGAGADVIKDFGKGNDKIEFVGVTGSLDDAVQVGDDVVFDFGGGNSLTLEDVSLASLDDTMFI